MLIAVRSPLTAFCRRKTCRDVCRRTEAKATCYEQERTFADILRAPGLEEICVSHYRKKESSISKTQQNNLSIRRSVFEIVEEHKTLVCLKSATGCEQQFPLTIRAFCLKIFSSLCLMEYIVCICLLCEEILSEKFITTAIEF